MENTPVEISLLGQVLRLGCPPEHHDFLRLAAKDIEERAMSMRERSGILNLERILAIVALNLSFELKQEQEKQQKIEQVLTQRIQQIDDSLEKFGLNKNHD